MVLLQFRQMAPLAALIVTLAACGPSAQDARTGGAQPSSGPTLVSLDGSSTVFPISEAVAEEFQKADKNVRVTVGISGTGGGFQKFCRGEIDIADASRPISATEVAACDKAGIQFIELPIAYDGIAIAVNPKNTWADLITVAELKTLWGPDAQGKVTKWSQIRKGWPDREIHLFGGGVDSGTYDYFTEAINGKAKSSRGDFTSSEDDNVLVQGIGNDELALGFLPFAYFEENAAKLKLVPVDDGQADNGGGPIAKSTCSAPASTRALTTTSPRRSMAKPRPAAATSRRAKTTTCWSRASATTSSRSGSCPLPTSKRTAPS